jgi:hypothetical protein
VRVNGSLAVALSVLMVALGVAILARTIAEGGGQVGIIFGVLFLAAGGGRLYLARRRI